MHRKGPNVWDQQARQNSQCRAMGMIGMLMIAGGTCLMAQAYKGRVSSAVKMRFGSFFDGRKRDHVNRESNDSFPASDPPSWTPALGRAADTEHRLS